MFKADAQHECENCGALLPPPDAGGVRTCKFCNATYSIPAAAPAAPPMAAPQVNVVLPSSVTIPEFQPINADEMKKAGGCAGLVVLLVALVIIASIAVPVYFVLKEANFDLSSLGIGSGSSDGDATGSYALLPGEPGAPLAYVTAVQHYDSGSSSTVREVIKVDGTNQKSVWKSKGFTSDGGDWPILTDGSSVYLAVKSKVVAMKGTDGSVAWEGSLSDEFSTQLDDLAPDGSCSGCFAVLAGRVVVKSKDGVLQAFDTTTGAPAWTRRLEDVSAEVLRVGGHLVAIDGKGGDYAAIVLDPATGAETAIITPTCTDGRSSDDLSSFSIAHPSPNGSALTFWFGTIPSCIQRWDVAANAMVWNIGLASGSTPSAHTFEAIETETTLVFSDGGELSTIDVASGAAGPTLTFEEAEGFPIAAGTSLAIVEVETRRGTAKHELWGVDLATGQKSWGFSLGTAVPAEGPNGSPSSTVTSGSTVFTAHLDGNTIHVVSFNGDSKQVTIQTVDAVTGAATPAVTPDWRSGDLIPSFGPAVWNGSRVLVRVGDDLLTVDAAKGAIAFEYP